MRVRRSEKYREIERKNKKTTVPLSFTVVETWRKNWKDDSECKSKSSKRKTQC